MPVSQESISHQPFLLWNKPGFEFLRLLQRAVYWKRASMILTFSILGHLRFNSLSGQVRESSTHTHSAIGPGGEWWLLASPASSYLPIQSLLLSTRPCLEIFGMVCLTVIRITLFEWSPNVSGSWGLTQQPTTIKLSNVLPLLLSFFLLLLSWATLLQLQELWRPRACGT